MNGQRQHSVCSSLTQSLQLGWAANQDPFWGQPSSGVDWCEANYVHSRYVAEFFNTMSSIPMLIVSLWGLFLCIKYQLEIRFYLCWFGIGVVGIGSVAFHGTLHPTGQQPGIYLTTRLKGNFWKVSICQYFSIFGRLKAIPFIFFQIFQQF